MTVLRSRHAAGFSVLELLLALSLSFAVATGVLRVLDFAHRMSRVQPDAADVRQRLRLAAERMTEDIVGAGAGPLGVPTAPSIASRIPPVVPYRLPAGTGDAEQTAYADRLSMLLVTEDDVYAPLAETLLDPAQPLEIRTDGCGARGPSCGFRQGDVVLIVSRPGTFDVVTLSGVTGNRLEHELPLSRSYDPIDEVFVMKVRVRTFSHDAVRRQLRMGLDAGEFPLVDEILGFSARLFGVADPTELAPPAPGSWPCVMDGSGRWLLAPLPSPGGLAEIGIDRLTDGPWCGSPPNRFDADLFRVRTVAVQLRAGSDRATARGPAGRWFQRPGVAGHGGEWVPDREIDFQVALRNVAGGT